MKRQISGIKKRKPLRQMSLRFGLWPVFFQRCSLCAALAFAAVLVACGSEKDADKKARIPAVEEKTDAAKGDPARAVSDQRAKTPYVFEAKVADPASQVGCSSALVPEVVLGQDYPSGSQTFLVANLAPECFENRYPVLRLKIDKTFRIAAPVSCKKVEVADFNFECVGSVGQFVTDQRVAVPVNITAAESANNLRAEVEYVVPAAR